MSYGRVVYFGVLLSATLIYTLLGNCSGFMDTDPQYTGFITHIQPDQRTEGRGWLLVESHADKLVRRQKVLITDQTKVLIHEKGVDYPSNFLAFKTKRWVKIWFMTRLENSPQKAATARMVVIVEHP